MTQNIVLQTITERGTLTIAEYMELCLQDPTEGYYSTQKPIGAHGDFVTAPEISQMFGEIIGIWFLDLWEKMGRPDKVNLLELGPGRGTLMADILRVLERQAPQVWNIHLVEINPHLQQLQANALVPYPQLSWHTDIRPALESCDEAPLFIIANEFFDALPIHQFKREHDEWLEHIIRFDPKDQKIISLWQPANKPTLPSYIDLRAEPGKIIEVCPAAQHYMASLTEAMLKHTGAMLIIDYGYTLGTNGDTLQAIRHHRSHSVFENPGLADITAHVDFKALADTATANGATTFGPIHQGDFLLHMGILTRANALVKNATASQQQDIQTALMRLIHPQHMGTLFKVLAATSPHVPQPQGFLPC